uniref:Fibrinogen C-terminal domain-containing protein n=1 Tax=Anopheles christyi TaxID=43041 RepID=A0A182K3L2_9DIPT
MTKLEYLEYKLVAMESAMKETDQKLSGAINQLSQKIEHNQIQSYKSERTANANNEQLKKDIQKLASKEDLALIKVNPDVYLRSISSPSCVLVSSNKSGKYLIQPTEYDEPFLGYCEQTTFGGGWLVIQYRYDGSIDFYRNWTEYRNGFGSIEGEFWLGLEHLHRFTSARSHELLVELKDFSGNYVYAQYDEFGIGSEELQYPITKLGTYTGTAGDSLRDNQDEMFSTMDRDNDGSPSESCAAEREGAWWYLQCTFSNLNGVYTNSEDPKSMNWYHYKTANIGLAYSRMLIRPNIRGAL